MRRVLVVDEDDDFRMRLKAYLERLGFEVTDLAKLTQARELYVKGAFVLVKVDVHTNMVWEGLSWAADIYKAGQRVILLHPHSFRWKSMPVLVKSF